ncbi:MAG: DNA-directed RNA polymerase subunit beta' [Nitrospinaceae bacterium]|nr:DNA-directed RNA polymerase subunit beta' [Nitrospinaceae bacterium]NIR54538.1 DNA-directed RNA polymerase subunit beta' [Nitrospinaceae bacterium]NIS84957.1 DNA-directed RNA polymerase subunit beta' [Nitrospinaceae bacterium]NIT81771.1 DNA-directed RNA polymerase subunit beta' [Nitrospinaceae bacterium]NIU44040.1 DNA-directed RNA polymerase subunit beta' [Nitrospinaceae bacterium]
MFDAIRIRLASPEKIRSWSYGEVKKPETINYRTFKPERDGLFCAKIFGPVKDWECNCGKYKRMKHRGVICEKCGVEVILSKVRRERMGHIELASPVAHIWFFKGLPSRIGHILDLSLKELERIIYFENYVVVDPGESDFKLGQLLTEAEYREAEIEFPHGLKTMVGSEAVMELLKNLDLDAVAAQLKEDLVKTTSVLNKRKLSKRLKIVEAFRKSGNKPEWMILQVVPVIPPELRPLVPLDGGRFATSDLNDLYRRVINRNNRLKRLQELKAPQIIIRNEKRMLQEAVSALFDNGRRGRTLRGTNKRPLKSLSDMLKGKQGRFRQNLLGKRVDYSGRSVIVVGPELKLHQCGLPKKMALELFKPFIFNRLEQKGYAATIKTAKKMVEQERSEVWEVLEEVIQKHPVLLNRAPTLHRLGIQAFEPILIEGKAIRIHPLVCTAFNADFDGDQMAVHVPLSMEAQVEAKLLMMAPNNVLSPANGRPIAVPSQDIVLGCYYMTKIRGGCLGEGRVFSGPDEVRMAFDHDELDLQARIMVQMGGRLEVTTTGRVIMGEGLPKELPFSLVNQEMNKKSLSELIGTSFKVVGREKTVALLDFVKELGFKYATEAGLSISIDHMRIPEQKEHLVTKAGDDVLKVYKQYQDGLITNGERYNKVIDIWAHVTERVSEEMFRELETADERIVNGEDDQDFNSIFIMADSGARGSSQQLRQLAGMRGLMAKPSGEIIETPITANFREGLSVIQYFISTHGARKGLADTALKTANSGYLTRRLVDVAQDIIILEEDCGTLRGIDVFSLVEAGEIIQPLSERILGRTTLEDIVDPFTGNVLIKANEMIDEEGIEIIENAGIEKVRIRSNLTCESHQGLCVKCYGRNLATNDWVEIGEPVGVIAAQSIGEPGTQLTMRTFHIGGTVSRAVEQTTLSTKKGGIVKYTGLRTIKSQQGEIIVMNRNGYLAIQDEHGREKEKYSIVYAAKLKVADGQEVQPHQTLVEWDPYTNSILTEEAGTIAFGDVVEGVTMKEDFDETTGLSSKVIISHRDEKKQPRISIKDDNEETLRRYLLPAGALINVNEHDRVNAGDVIVKIPRETAKTKDITGGLPRVAELFEARKPHEQATITEIDGKVKFGGFVKGMRKVVVVSEGGEEREYLIPHGKHINVHEGDDVVAGEPLMDGASNPHDILRILGENELQKYLVNEVQEVYRLQGVTINDKHIEIIVRQMLRHLQVEDPGDTDLLIGEQITKKVFNVKNQEVIKDKGKPAQGMPVLLGITKSSLSTESFISSASFQETTRVLTEVAVSGKEDRLVGLKENVIMGRLIPAGTGCQAYTGIRIEEPEIEGAEEEEKPEETAVTPVE